MTHRTRKELGLCLLFLAGILLLVLVRWLIVSEYCQRPVTDEWLKFTQKNDVRHSDRDPIVEQIEYKYKKFSHNQEFACYMVVTAYFEILRQKTEAELFRLGGATIICSRGGTWEEAHLIELPKGKTCEMLVVDLVKKYGKKGKLEIFMGPFVIPSSCNRFIVSEKNKESNITIELVKNNL